MGASDLDGRRLKPSIKGSRTRWRVVPAAAIAKNKIVIASGKSGAYMQVTAASNANEVSRTNTLFITQTNANSATAGVPNLEVATQGHVTDVNTNGATIGDPVYLSTAGAFTLTKTGTERLVGIVTSVSATTGSFWFDGTMGAQEDTNILWVNGVIVASGATFGTVSVGTAWNGATVFGACLQAVPTNATVNVVAGAVTTGTLRIDLTGDPGAGGALVNCILYKGTADVTDS